MDSQRLYSARLTPAGVGINPGAPLAIAQPLSETNAEAAATVNATVNAALLASLPRSELDALLPEQPVQVQPTFAPGRVDRAEDLAALGPPAWFDAVGGGSQHGGAVLERSHHLAASPRGRAQEAATNVELGPTAVTGNLVNRAREAGLSEAELVRLESILRNGGHFGTDAALVAELLGTENAARALRTFMDLDPIRQQNPKRITADCVRDLTLGVGRARTGAGEGREGILTETSALAAATALVEMRAADFELINYSLMYASLPVNPAADPQTQYSLILKAVAARSERLCNPEPVYSLKPQPSAAAREISSFALAIRGVDAKILIERTSGIDIDGDDVDEALQQKWQNASAAAALQMARAEADPIYAWTLHNGVLHDAAPAGPAAEEQKKSIVLHGGTPAVRDSDGPARDDMVLATMDDAVSPSTGLTYLRRTVGDGDVDRTAAMDHIQRLVEEGADVPIAVTSSTGGSRAMLITDVRGSGDLREFVATDPWSGRTAWVSGKDIRDGNVDGAGGALSDYWW